MSLDNIQLPPFLIADLYKDSLVQLDVPSEIKPIVAALDDLKFLGTHQQYITILVNEPNAVHINEQDLSFLVAILQACKLTLADVAILNICQQPTSYQELQSKMQSKTLILFGISTDSVKLPINFPNYQIQQFNQQSYLIAPPLRQLAAQKEEKLLLWGSLKKLFNI